MIKITKKENCVGCNACVQRCPRQCISMVNDEQGFFYPKVEVSLCIECGLCEKVCPVINQYEPRDPISTYAAKNNDEEIKLNSSSGGVFYALAKSIIDEGGVVFGVRFDSKWEVVHDYTEKIEGIRAFQTSKYVQSRIGETYLEAERFLKNGRKVLFTGTPCQIAGLKLFLRKEYDNLLTVDVACHGTPSPLVWRQYLEYITRPNGTLNNTVSPSNYNHYNDIHKISSISFRDKRIGWEKYGFSIHYATPKCVKNSDSQSTISEQGEKNTDFFQPHQENLFMQCFLKDLCLRPSCYECPFKCGKSHSDITLADFWGIQNAYTELYKKGYYSLVLQGTSKVLLDRINISKEFVDINIAVSKNPAIIRNVVKPKLYNQFWIEFERHGIIAIQLILNKMRPSIIKRVIRKIKGIIR